MSHVFKGGRNVLHLSAQWTLGYNVCPKQNFYIRQLKMHNAWYFSNKRFWENFVLLLFFFYFFFKRHILVIVHSEKERETATVERRQRLNGEVINSILRLSIYCVKFWKSMEKSWHHFQPIPGQEVHSVWSRQFYSPLLNSPWQTLRYSDTICQRWHYLATTVWNKYRNSHPNKL